MEIYNRISSSDIKNLIFEYADTVKRAQMDRHEHVITTLIYETHQSMTLGEPFIRHILDQIKQNRIISQFY